MVDLCLQLLYALGASAENYLAPDAYAAFRQSQTYPLSHNLWLQYLNKSLDYHLEWPTQTQKVKYADDMARLLYHSFNFTSVEIQRTEDFALVHSALHSRPHPHDPPAPFLTSSGFIDAVVYDLLDEPVNALARLNLALEIYRPASYTEKDHVPIPREALPSTAIIQGNMEFQELKRRGNENLRDTLQY
ncbi:MAG: hypothetical protein M1838_005542 [Thelocarpon superellum]|nr:MAG: hypothetical protein M1838_005542 [Thelocarpon superellum]